MAATDKAPDAPVYYVSDNGDDGGHERPPPRRIKRVLSQRQPAEGDSLHRIVALAAKETAVVPPLDVEQHKLTTSQSTTARVDNNEVLRGCMEGGTYVSQPPRGQTKEL